MLLSVNKGFRDKHPIHKSNPFSVGWKPCDLNVDELTRAVKDGYAISAQFKQEQRRGDNFVASGFLAVDIDDGLTLQQALQMPMVKNNAALVYTTPSHADSNHRFRIVFNLQTPIMDADDYQHALTGLIEHFGSDKSCRDAARIFYGSTTAVVHRIDKILGDADVQALVETGREAAASATQYGLPESEFESTDASRSNRMRTNAFDMDLPVTDARGTLYAVRDMPSGRCSIHCPFHIDSNPSAVLFRTSAGRTVIRCYSCAATFWQSSDHWQPDFYWTKKYEDETRRYYQDQGFFSAGHDSEHDFNHENPPTYQAENAITVQLFNHRFLPPLTLRQGVTLIRSHKGSGKTKQLEDLVAECHAQGKKVLVVGHRKLLLSSLANRLKLPYYDTTAGRDEFTATGNLAVTVDSLTTLLDPVVHRFDAIIIDESEQVVAHFLSDTLRERRNLALMYLAFFIKHADHLIFLDADLGILTKGFIDIVLGGGTPCHLIVNAYTNPRPQREQAELRALIEQASPEPITSEMSTVDSATVTIHRNQTTLIGQLFEELNRRRGCFVATNSKALADLLGSTVQAKIPSIRMLVITADTSDLKEVRDFIREPSVQALKYDLVIYSPALSTGVDITFPDDAREVHSVFGLFEAGITTHFDIDQQLSRVRNPEAIHVWVSGRKSWAETDPTAVKAELIQNRTVAEAIIGLTGNGVPIYSEDESLFDLVSWITAVRRASINDLKKNFIELRETAGWVVEHEGATSGQKHSLARNEGRDEDWATNVCNAHVLDPDGYRWIVGKARGIGLSEIELHQKQRYEIETFYGESITPELVDLDDRGKFRCRFANLQIMFGIEDALMKQDQREIQSGWSSLDWKKRVQKRRLLRSVLSAAGIYSTAARFDFGAEITAESLGTFASTVSAAVSELKALFGLRVRSDLESKPMLQLKAILQEVGLGVTPSRSTRSAGKKTYVYKLDSERWQQVAGLNSMKIAMEIEDLHQKQSNPEPDPIVTILRERASRRQRESESETEET